MRRTAQIKTSATASTDNNDSDLPDGWALAALGDSLVTDVQTGFACGINNREGHGIAHLRPMNVNANGEIDLKDLKYVPESECDQDERLVRKGDVIFNNTNSTELVGKTAYYGLSQLRAFSNHMTRVRCHSDVLNSQFCSLALHQLWRGGYFQGVCNQHVSQSSVSRSVLLETEIALPPPAEQKRIVLKTEELAIQVNASREHLAKIPRILKRFRQSVLSAACSGRLTEDWRDTNPVGDAAKELLSKILTERKARTRSAKEPCEPDTSLLGDVPEEWIVVSTDALMSHITSGSRDWKRYYRDGGTGTFVMAKNVRPLRFDTSVRQGVQPPQVTETASAVKSRKAIS